MSCKSEPEKHPSSRTSPGIGKMAIRAQQRWGECDHSAQANSPHAHTYIRHVEVGIREVPDVEDDGGPMGRHMPHGDRGVAALAQITQETDPDWKLSPGGREGGVKWVCIV